MKLDFLLQFYWPSRKRHPGKDAARRGNRRLSGEAQEELNESRDRKLPVWIVVLGIVWLLAFSVEALGDKSRMADQRNVIFDRLGTGQGLSQAAVSAITQDKQGFIWVGTQEGLNRYDGYEFQTFYHMDDDPNSLSHDSIWDLMVDSDGSLWIGTDSGLNRYDADSGRFEFYSLDTGLEVGGRHVAVHTMFQDSSQRMWIGTSTGLVQLTGDGEFISYTHQPGNPETIGRGSVRAIFEDSQGRLWIGTELGGLNLFDPSSGSFIRYESVAADPDTISDNYIRNIIEDRSGNLWLATFNGGVSIFNPATGEAERLRHTASLRVRALLMDQQGSIWVGTDGGLNLWNPATRDFERYTVDPTDIHSISDNTVFEIFQDQGGVIWVGTFNGISKWNARTETFPHFKQSARSGQNLTSNSITSFAETREGDVWIGSFEGLNRWNATLGTFVDTSGLNVLLSDDLVMSLAIHDDLLWVGTMAGGINLVEGNEVIGVIRHDPADPSSISSDAVSKIFVDSKNQVWLTTYGGGVNLYLGDGKFRRFPDPANPLGRFRDLRTLDITEANDGNLWIATDGGGVVILDPETGNTRSLVHNPDDVHSLSSDNVISILRTSTEMWIGTRDRGMNRFDAETESFTRYTKADGLGSDAVYGMLEDEQGRIWISGGKGMSVLGMRDEQFTKYDSSHGLQSDDFNSGAYLKLSDGSFLFGGSNGFNAFDPARIRGNDYAPPVRITAFTKFNEVQSLAESITTARQVELDYNDFVIGFAFAAMDFTAPEKNQFRYMLEGFDRNWIESNGARQVTYTNLDAGTYTFKLVGSNNDGVWGDEELSLTVVVNPPLWATWWAYLCYLLVVVAALYQVQKANEQRLRREAEKRYSERLQLYIESLEEATDCVLIADANKSLMYANNAIQQILGLTPGQAEGKSIMSLLFSDPTDASQARAGLQTEGRWHGEVRSRKGLEPITMEVTIAAVRDENENETAYVSITRDVTDRKKTESELENHRRNLEFLVAERTKALEREIAENKAVQRELANSLQEKELLLKEVHHRVKNNMQVISSLLNIQAETVGNDLFASLLGESQQRIKSMSLIHENLYQSDNLLEIDFEDYINMLANSLCRFYQVPGVSIGLDVDVQDVALDIETAVPCGLIINELVSNSLKHAFRGRQGSGTIFIRFHHEGCRYVLEIGDDGNGLPEGFELSTSASMGMEIVSILTQQLDGRLRFNSDEGARFEISFPRKEKHVQ